MTVTKAEATALTSTATRFEQVNDSLRGKLRRLMSELDVLHSQWQGAGGRSFAQVKVAWAQDQEQLHSALGETATAMRSAASQYTSTDSTASERFRPRTGGSVTLPL